MSFSETIILEHPETCEEVELKVSFYYCKEQRPTMDDPGCPEEFEIVSVSDSEGNEYYSDDDLWSDEDIISALREQSDNRCLEY